MTAPTLTHYQDGINFTARAAETISGGQLVKAMSSFAAGTSEPFQVVDVMQVNATNDGENCVGIALNNAGSTGLVDVCTRGLFKMKCGAAVVAGQYVQPMSVAGSADTVQAAGYTSPGAGSSVVVGRALNDAAANENAFILLDV